MVVTLLVYRSWKPFTCVSKQWHLTPLEVSQIYRCLVTGVLDGLWAVVTLSGFFTGSQSVVGLLGDSVNLGIPRQDVDESKTEVLFCIPLFQSDNVAGVCCVDNVTLVSNFALFALIRVRFMYVYGFQQYG